LPNDLAGNPVNIYFMKHCSSGHFDVFLSCFSFYSFNFQTVYAGGSLNRGRDSLHADVFDSGAHSPSRSPCQCTEYLSRISDLEGCVSLMKHQAKTTLDQADKSYGLMR
jgi:hypothetical protein